MTKVYISWETFDTDCVTTVQKIKHHSTKIHTIVALSRGGLVPARIIAEHIKPKNFIVMGLSLYDGDKRGQAIEVYQPLPYGSWRRDSNNILVIDDVSDGGTTLHYVYHELEKQAPKSTILTATPYIKTNTKFVPDFYAREFSSDEWLVFPFEKD